MQGMVRENWRPALSLGVQSRRIWESHIQMTRCLRLRAGRTQSLHFAEDAQPQGSWQDQLKRALTVPSAGIPLSPWDKVATPVAACAVLLQLHLQLLVSVTLLWPPFPS